MTDVFGVPLEPVCWRTRSCIGTDRPEWVPSYNPVYTLVYTTIVDGRSLMESRELKTIDFGEVAAKCRELAPKLAERANVKPESRWPVV